MVEDRADWIVPVGGHGQTFIVKRATLARTVERDDVVAGVAQEDKGRCHFLYIAVEASEKDDRAFGAQGLESIGGQESAHVTVRVGHGLALPKLKGSVAIAEVRLDAETR